MWMVTVISGNFGNAAEIARELLPMARALGDRANITNAYFLLVVVNAHMGRLHEALAFADEAAALSHDLIPPPYHLAMYEPVTAIDAEATRIVWALCSPDEALRRAEVYVARERTVVLPAQFGLSLALR